MVKFINLRKWKKRSSRRTCFDRPHVCWFSSSVFI